MSAADLLIELGCEELPPKALLTLSEAFRQQVETRLQEAKLNFSAIETFATPRRLALKVLALDEKQADIQTERFGPALQAAFDDAGNPSKAAEGFARSCGVEVSQLEQKNDGKVDKLFFSVSKAGEATAKLLPKIINEALDRKSVV